MKLVSRSKPKNIDDEVVTLLPEDPEDMVRPLPSFILVDMTNL